MKNKARLKKIEKLMDGRKKERAEQSLDKNPKKAGLEKSMRDIADVAKKEGLNENSSG